uniref:TRAF-5 n=1 Tax=Dendrocoelum lacteum TaxID=27895 RepID=T1D122_9PLAT
MKSVQSVPVFLDDLRTLSRCSCGICKQIMFEPTQSQCGCRFCSKCIEEFISKEKRKCPICTDQNIEKVSLIRDKAIEKEIMRMRVQCPQEGCGENIMYREWGGHERACVYGVNECEKCGEEYVRSRKEDHEREECGESVVKCDDCGKEMRREDLKNVHKNYDGDEESLCEKWMCKCPYQCTEEQYVNMKEHASSCRERCTPCPLKDIGCEVKGPQGELKVHLKEAVGLHQILMLKEIKDLREQKEEMKKMLREKEEDHRKKYEELREINKDNETSVKELKEKVDHITKYSESLLSELTTYKSNSHPKEPLTDIEASLRDVTWSIKDIRKKIQEAKCGGNNELISECFYVFRPGYNMSLKVFLNGDGRATNKYLSTFFVINKGEYDSQISWPFKSRVLLSILSNNLSKEDIVVRMKPNNNDQCYGRPSGRCNLGAGQPDLVELSEILNKDYYLHHGALKLRLTLINL